MEWLQRFYAKKFILTSFSSPRVHAVRGGINQVLWAEKFWNGHPRKLDREIFEDYLSAKIGPLENFPLYGIFGQFGSDYERGREGSLSQGSLSI